jgi:hypothetical protein
MYNRQLINYILAAVSYIPLLSDYNWTLLYGIGYLLASEQNAR